MEFENQWVKDPKYYAIGREKACSDHRYYGSKEEMLKDESRFKYSLNGVWKFHYAKNMKETIQGFEKKEYNCKDWDNIQVPGHIQMQGYGTPMYVNTMYPWSGREEIRPGEIPEHFNPVGSYVLYFEIPEHMKGKPLYIRFHGVESAMALWLNGEFIGYSEDSFTPSAFCLTDHVCDGENKLAVQVFKYSSGSWLEDQDFWRFSGIFRDVELYTIPEIHIQDIFIKTLMEEPYTKACLDLEIEFIKKNNGTLDLELLDPDGDMVYHNEYPIDSDHQHLCVEVEEPLLWSAEYPHLYTLILTIKENDQVHEVTYHRVGFRSFELRGNVMYLNGKRIVFNGVNRHEFSAKYGRAVKPEEILEDILIVKQNNINAIRTSHYPNSTYFYELCDEYGIYVIDEANLETHGTWCEFYDMDLILPNDKPEWEGACVDRAASMLQRDKNHPCILMWSCGNESHGGKDIYEMSRYFKEHDSTRLVHYEGIARDRRYNETSDVESQMYTPAKEVEEYLQAHDDKPFILCEYAHAMGTSNGAVDKYVDLAKKYPHYQGGFIWDFVDQAIYTLNQYHEPYYAYGGDFGERPSDFDFCGNGLVFANRELTPKMQEIRYLYQNIDINIDEEEIHLTNRYLFTDLNEFVMTISILKDGKVIESTETIVNVEPGETYSLPHPFAPFDDHHEYCLQVVFTTLEDRLYHESGLIVAREEYVYPYTPKVVSSNKTVRMVDDYANVGVIGENFRIIFSKVHGGIEDYHYLGRSLLKEQPKPNFYRASTQNDTANRYGYRYGDWLIASLYQKGTFDHATLSDDHKSVDVVYYHDLTPNMKNKLMVNYHVTGEGKVEVTMDFEADPNHIEMPEFGMMFKLPLCYDQVEYYGLGPDENYIDRCLGAMLGVYHYDIYENVTPNLMPQECGNRTGVRYFDIYDKDRVGLHFESEQMEFSALPYQPLELEYAKHPYELPAPYQCVVRVNQKQMGVAGDNTWGARTHDEYLLSNKEHYCFKFSFIGTIK